jgi:hypothetical protein
MAKKGGSGKTYTSKGERKSSYGVKRRDPAERILNKMKALAKGKDVVFTIENPNKNETNRRFIKYKVYGKDYLKSGKAQGYMIKGGDA